MKSGITIVIIIAVFIVIAPGIWGIYEKNQETKADNLKIKQDPIYWLFNTYAQPV